VGKGEEVGMDEKERLKRHPKGWAGRSVVSDEFEAWARTESSIKALIGPSSRSIAIRIVPEDDYLKMLKAWKDAEKEVKSLGERFLLTESDGTLPAYGTYHSTDEVFKNCARPVARVKISMGED
jgi:hypothetical protein